MATTTEGEGEENVLAKDQQHFGKGRAAEKERETGPGRRDRGVIKIQQG